MQILFTADIHIKLGQKNVPIPWAKNRYKLLIESLAELQPQCDMFIIGGDIFDKVPNMEELEIYYDLVAACKIETIIYPGNHESVKKDTTFLTYLKTVTNRLNSKVTIVDDYFSTDDFDILPYNRLKQYRPSDVDFHSNILFTHVRGEIPPHVKPEIDLGLLSRWDLVVAGDLHAHENSQLNIVYPGSPVTTSFHRNKVDTGVLIIDTEMPSYKWVKLDLPQLIRKTIQAGDDMPATFPDHTIYEIEGDMAQLSGVEDHELIDKKVVKRENDTALILTPNMSLLEELEEYLLYILELDESTVSGVLQVYNNNVAKLND